MNHPRGRLIIDYLMGPVSGLLLFILTRDVGRVSIEGEKVLVGVENFFSDFACLCGRKKELRNPSR